MSTASSAPYYRAAFIARLLSIAFNRCRNRHCPKCQSLVRAQWLEERQGDLIPVDYFHVVFTVPEEIAAIAYQNKAVVYEIMFHATAETSRTIAADPKHLGAEIGFLAILHTWDRIWRINHICIVWSRTSMDDTVASITWQVRACRRARETRPSPDPI